MPRDLSGLQVVYNLKQVERATSVQKRKESSAEHSWSCLILANYFLSIMKTKLNKVKVYELLLYHDVVEIEAGDVCITKEEERKNKKECERKAMEKLKKLIPPVLQRKLANLFLEFEESSTPEAKFANAVDKLDAVIQELDYRRDWKGWTEEFLRKKKEPYFKDFPEINKMFEEATKMAREKGHFNRDL